MSQRTSFGFGFEPAKSPYHFAVAPFGDDGSVTIEERFTWGSDEAGGGEPRKPLQKAVLDSYRWSRVRETARTHFNRRLKEDGLPAGRWTPNETLLAPHLGKELTLLAWAIEDADPTLIPSMAANWLGLAPEERWWLYTTINATAGHPFHGRERGWRKAIKIAFAENPADTPPSTLLDAGFEGVRLPLAISPSEPEPEQPGFAIVRSYEPEAPGDSCEESETNVFNSAERPSEGRPVGRTFRGSDGAAAAKRPRKTATRSQLPLLPEDQG